MRVRSKKLTDFVVRLVVAVFVVAGMLIPVSQVAAQASVGFLTQRPFVIGFIPVVGRNGAVGGVSIDADGVVARAEADETGRLRDARARALKEIPGDVSRYCALRKVSLRRLEAAILEHAKKEQPLGDEILYLAGLQHISYVFVYPEENDIVLAGPAESWRIDEQGNIVGRSTGQPVLELADLVVALRSADESTTTGISCSIDPDEEGLTEFMKLLKGRSTRFSASTTTRMERVLGPQNVTLEGIAADCHFARVMVAADVMLKRLAMNMEAAPIEGLPGYLELVQAQTGSPPRMMMPRWWLAPDYKPLLSDADGLAWQIRGGVKAMTETEFVDASGERLRAADSDPLAERWAAVFTEKYGTLAERLPVFAQLRNCMDLAIVAALISRYDIAGLAGFEMPLLMNPKAIAVAEFNVPKTVPSQAVAFKKGRDWVVSISGGVQIDAWSIAGYYEESEQLIANRKESVPPKGARWWWD